MAFNQNVQRRILRDTETKDRLPCVMCGTRFPLPEAAHIIDGKEWTQTIGAEQLLNGIPLCPNCHKVFDDVLRLYLYRALEAFGATGLPKCWKKSNKVSDVTDRNLPNRQIHVKSLVIRARSDQPSPNGMQLIAPCVTLAASGLCLSPTAQPARQPPPSLSLRSLGDFRAL